MMPPEIVVDRAITLTQPWATLMAIDAKRIETRSWATQYRGWVAIHAAKGFPRDCQSLCYERQFHDVLLPAGFARPSDLPRGKILAVVYLLDCRRTEEIRQTAGSDRDFGDFSFGRYGFVTERGRRLREPIEAKGALGIWRLPRPITENDLL